MPGAAWIRPAWTQALDQLALALAQNLDPVGEELPVGLRREAQEGLRETLSLLLPAAVDVQGVVHRAP